MVDHKERLFECVARFDFFASCLRQGNPTIEEQMEMASDLNRATVRIAGAAYHIEQLEAALDDQIQWGDRLPYHATDRVQGALDTIEALEKRVRELEQERDRAVAGCVNMVRACLDRAFSIVTQQHGEKAPHRDRKWWASIRAEAIAEAKAYGRKRRKNLQPTPPEDE